MLIGGHRGSGKTDGADGRSDVPQENSKASINRAFAMGADFIETDLCLDSEGRGWLTHSSDLARHIVVPPRDYLDQLTSSQAAKLIGLGQQPLYGLDELLTDHAHHRVNLEIKLRQGTERPYEMDLNRLADRITQWPETWWLSSFDTGVLTFLNQQWPNLKLAQLTLDSARGQPLFPDDPQGVQAFSDAAGQSVSWAIHAEASDAIVPVDTRPIYVWSMRCDQSQWPDWVDGVITDRLEQWLGP